VPPQPVVTVEMLEPANGVICTAPSTRYVKFTIAEVNALTGASTNDRWYFKIFSFSA